MAWSNSKIFQQLIDDGLSNIGNFDLEAGTVTAALYNDSITPDNTVTAANSAYNVGQWGTANEVYEAGQWAQGGVALTGPEVVSSAGVITVDDDDSNTASGANADLASVFGCLVYDGASTTVVDQGACYNYFGGSNSVVDGTFTIVWNASGIFAINAA